MLSQQVTKSKLGVFLMSEKVLHSLSYYFIGQFPVCIRQIHANTLWTGWATEPYIFAQLKNVKSKIKQLIFVITSPVPLVDQILILFFSQSKFLAIQWYRTDDSVIAGSEGSSESAQCGESGNTKFKDKRLKSACQILSHPQSVLPSDVFEMDSLSKVLRMRSFVCLFWHLLIAMQIISIWLGWNQDAS